jgi:hypothetical protein
MSDVNGLFIAPGYGNAAFYVIHVAYGVAASVMEAESANQRTAYFHNVYADNFVISMQFNSWENYNAAALWFSGFMLAAVASDGAISPMTVAVPSRNFVGVGVPETGVSFGDHVPAITYPMTVSFVSALDAQTPTEVSWVPPANPGPANSSFYPLDNGASPYYDSVLFDAPTPPVAATPNNGANVSKVTSGRKPQ